MLTHAHTGLFALDACHVYLKQFLGYFVIEIQDPQRARRTHGTFSSKAQGQMFCADMQNPFSTGSQSMRSIHEKQLCSPSAERIKIYNLLNPVSGDGRSGGESMTDKQHSTVARETDSNIADKRQARRFWTDTEDELLVHLVKKHGARHWNKLARSFVDRCGAQLRARWAHTLSDERCNRPYSPSEDAYILEAQRRIGNHWARIADDMDHRNGNGVKNRFKCISRRAAGKRISC
mmetsp:Transcript_12799/g.27906  ORF Transcript_12799/g.27906 Transcript_12799/m.27906 type:complete len:234 (+) Transcript_12799:221-922(+)